MKMNDFKVGDLILIHTALKHGIEIRSARVSDTNYKDNGLVTYEGISYKNYLETGQGAFDPDKIGSKPFGIVKIEIVGFKALPVTWYPWYPMPGDTGYDLMC